MNGMLPVLQQWLASIEALAARAPELAARLAASSWPALALVAALALALLFAGVRFGRLLTAAGALAVGYGAGLALAGAVGGPMAPTTFAWAGGITLGVAAAIAPTVYPASLGALGGALLGLQLPVVGRGAVGAVVAAIALAAIALLMRRFVVALTAAMAGAAALSVVMLAIGRRYETLAIFRDRPLLLAGIAALLTVAGTAFQLGQGERRAGLDRLRRARQPLEG